MLKDAIALAEAGFSVIWLKERSKAPVAAEWSSLPTASVDQIRRTYRKGRNMGVRLGEPSRVEGFYLHVFDMDVRDASYAKEARRQLIDMLDLPDEEDLWTFPTVISGSGGKSRHFYFLAERPYRSKKVWHSKESFVDAAGKKHWCAEIELFGTGKQVALPPSIHPDTGRQYEWESPFDPEQTRIPLVEPDILDEITGQVDRDPDYEAAEVEPLGVSYREAEEYLDYLDLPEWCDDRAGWIKVGMALHHEFNGSSEAMDVWAQFSKQSRKYDSRVLRQQWKSFKDSREEPVTFASIVKASNEYRHEIDYEGIADEFDDDPAPRKERRREGAETENEEDGPAPIPADLMTVPGALGLAVDHYNATSVQAQPQFAVQTALALGSVVLGRHWTTDLDNYTSLYLVNLGATGSGKEFGRKFLSKVLSEAGVGHLMGPAKYASEAAILGELAWKPRHVTVYDEFGRILDSTRTSGNTNLRDAQTLLMSLFGTLDTEARPTAYSTNGKSKEQIQAARDLVVKRPAITVLGLSTPETFFDALSQDDVANGFMNRLLVVHSRQEETVELPRRWKKTPDKLNRWIARYGVSDDADFTGGESPTEVEDAEVVRLSKKAHKRLHQISQEIIDLKKEYRPMRLDGMFSRSREITLRIALVVCLSMDNSDDIEPEHLDWSWRYVHFHTMEMVENARKMMGAGPTIRVADHLADLIDAAGAKGMSIFELARKDSTFDRMDKRTKDEVIYRLEHIHNIIAAKAKASKGGRPTIRYVHADFVKERG